MNSTEFILIVCVALLAAGCAGKPATQAAAPQQRHCFNQASVSAFRAVDRETVNLRVGAADYYQIKLLGVCPDINWAGQIALQTAGTSQVCTGLDLTIHAPGPTGPQECAAESLRKMADAEVAALSATARP